MELRGLKKHFTSLYLLILQPYRSLYIFRRQGRNDLSGDLNIRLRDPAKSRFTAPQVAYPVLRSVCIRLSSLLFAIG